MHQSTLRVRTQNSQHAQHTHISSTLAQSSNNHFQQSIICYKEDKLVLELQPADFATLQTSCIAHKGMESGVLGAVCGMSGVEWSDGNAVLGEVCRAWSVG